MRKKSDSLVFKIAVIFLIFTVLTLGFSTFSTYYNQVKIYTAQCEETIRSIGEYLAMLIESRGDEFMTYQEYYMNHFEEVDIPYDFDEYLTAKKAFDEEFAVTYPGKTFGADVEFKDMPDELQKLWFIYTHEYWLLTFEEAREAFDIPYSYYLYIKEDIFNVVYLIDGERTAKEINGENYIYLGDEYYNDPNVYDFEWDTWFNGKALEGYQLWNNAWGHTYAYYTPLYINGHKLGLIGTEIDVDKVNRVIVGNTIKHCIGLVGVLVICEAVLLWVLNKLYFSKLRFLENRVEAFSKSKDIGIAGEIKEKVKGHNEIASLAIKTSDMMTELDEHVRNIQDISSENARIGAEIGIASKLQKDMLPKVFPDRKEIDLYATMTAAKEIGGDFYDFFFIDNDHLALVIADVSGKGVPAAMFMIKSLTSLRLHALPGAEPANILEKVNEDLAENNELNLFVTIWLGILSIKTGEVIMTNAGHEYPMIKKAGGCFEQLRNEHDPVVGVIRDMSYTNEIIKLDPGDTLFLYTDGVPDTKNYESARFGVSGMTEALDESQSDMPRDYIEHVLSKTNEFMDGADQFDDITMLCVKYNGNTGNL